MFLVTFPFAECCEVVSAFPICAYSKVSCSHVALPMLPSTKETVEAVLFHAVTRILLLIGVSSFTPSYGRSSAGYSGHWWASPLVSIWKSMARCRGIIRKWRRPSSATWSRTLPAGPGTSCGWYMLTTLFLWHLVAFHPSCVSTGINFHSFPHWRKWCSQSIPLSSSPGSKPLKSSQLN